MLRPLANRNIKEIGLRACRSRVPSLQDLFSLPTITSATPCARPLLQPGRTCTCSDMTGSATEGSRLARHDIDPYGLELMRLEEIPPARHLIIAARHAMDEALALVR